jgi:hypothetical protein
MLLKRLGVIRGKLATSRGGFVQVGLVVGVSFAAFIAASAAAAAVPAGGAVRFWVTPGSGAVDKIVVTGAIGDYGTATSINKDGNVNMNGDYVRVALKEGGFEVNAVVLNKKFANVQPTTVDKATCSFSFTGTGPVTLFNGSGAYKGLAGTLEVTETFAGIGPRYASGAKKGECNTSNSAQPVGFYSSILGVGKVTFT